MKNVSFIVRRSFMRFGNILFIFSDALFVMLLAIALFVPECMEMLVTHGVAIGSLAILSMCTIFYKIGNRLCGGLFSSKERRLFETVILTSFVVSSLYNFASLLLNFDFQLPNYIISGLNALAVIKFSVCCIIRMIQKKVAESKTAGDDNTKCIAIIGAGSAGKLLFEVLRGDKSNANKVWRFIDDDKNVIGTNIKGVTVDGPISSIKEILAGSPVTEIILAIPSLKDSRKKEILNYCSDLPYTLKLMPSSVLWLDDDKSKIASSIRAVNIEDLLGRDSINLENDELKALVSNKVILVTGGGGSIGSEICRQVAALRPKRLVIFDIAENSSYVLKRELDQLCNSALDIQVEIGSVREFARLKAVFKKYEPNIVFHAAAHKHVPLMENSPGEAIKNNVFATYNVVKLSAMYNCEKFVMLSTDKAVNPTNVMGATKRYCEMIVQAMSENRNCKTDFATVRFGNVLGSSGSVIPIFLSQIEHGGPVTITDKRIIRYFMTVSEAVSLVLKAAVIAKSSDTFVLDMGKPVKILSLAENLIRLSGYKPYMDIQIVETGLRPGEKLYEELLIVKDSVIATAEEKIFIEKQNRKIKMSEIEIGMNLLKMSLQTEDNEMIIQTLKKLVPTYKTPDEVNSCAEDYVSAKSEVKCTHQLNERAG